MGLGELITSVGVYPPSKLSGASLGVGLGEGRTPLPQPRSFRSLRPAAAHLRDGGGAAHQFRRPSAAAAAEGGGRGGGPDGGGPRLCWGHGAAWPMAAGLSGFRFRRERRKKASGVAKL